MFDILFKKSEVILDCFTYNAAAYEFFRFQEASNYMPNWWKNISNVAKVENNFVGHTPVPSMRGCSGIVDYYKLGFILPLWSDVIIRTNTNGYGYAFGNQESEISEHHSAQHNHTFDYHHAKFVVPWAISCDKDINFLASSPFWNLATDQNLVNNFHILPGIINFKYQNNIHVNAFLTKKDGMYELKANTPIYHLYSNTDKTIKLRHHLIEADNKIFKMKLFSFKNNYFKTLKFSKIKKYD